MPTSPTAPRRLAAALSTASLVAFAGAAAAQPAPAPTAEPPAEPTSDLPQPPLPPTDEVSEPPVEAPVEPAPAPAAEGRPISARYDKGLTFSTDDDWFQLKVNFRNQLRFETERPLDDQTDGADSEFSSHFVIPRSRLQAEGHVFSKDTRFKLEFAFGDEGSFAFLKDLFIDQKLADGPIYLRLGQWKRPFNRQELVSDFASEFNERAITAAFVGGGRDMGVALHNDYEKSKDGLEWAVGVFNDVNGGDDRPALPIECEAPGECEAGRPANFPGDFQPALVARAGWNMGGIKGYSEADLEGGPLRLAIGGSYKVGLADLDSDLLTHGAQLDALLKVEGIDVLVGTYMTKTGDADPLFGTLLQAGYFITPKQLQIAGRFAGHQVRDGDDEGQAIEARGAFNWYFQGHAWKLATDFGILQTLGDGAFGDDKADIVVRTMAQLTI
jgi:hypothetical protein